MKKALHIRVSIDQPELVENMIETLACKKIDIGYALSSKTGDWKAVDPSSVEKYITGELALDLENMAVRIPFVSSFLFTCTKEKNVSYKLNWSMSLS